jgi:hypothetical protein
MSVSFRRLGCEFLPGWQHRERKTGTDLEYYDAAAELSDPPPETGQYLAATTRELAKA